MTAAIFSQPQTEREMFVNRCCNRLIQELMKEHRNRSVVSVAHAAGFGIRSLESGASYFEAMEIAEDMLRFGDNELLDLRNQERLMVWRAKMAALNKSKEG